MNAAQTGDRGRPRIGREPRIGLLDPRPGSRVSLRGLREESLWGLLPAARAEAGERSVAGFSPVLAAHLCWPHTCAGRSPPSRAGRGGRCAPAGWGVRGDCLLLSQRFSKSSVISK